MDAHNNTPACEPLNLDLLSKVLNEIPVPVAIKQATTRRFLFANRAVQQLWGLTESAVAKTPEEAFAAEQAALIRFYDDEALKRGEPLVVGDHPNLVDTGESKVVASTRFTLHSPEDGEQYIVSVVEDRTDKSRLEKQLRDHRDFLKTVLDNVPLPIVVKSLRSGTYVLANRAAVEFVGKPPEEIIGHTTSEVWSGSTAAQVMKQEAQLLSNDGICKFSERVFDIGAAEPRLLNCTRLLLRDNQGRPEYTLSIVEDVTEEQAAEDQILRLANYDHLTGLPNRKLFLEALQVAIETAADGDIAVHYLDLDQFKIVNDTLGHSFGDAMLTEVASRFRQVLANDNALVARMGGDEFAILQRDAADEDAIVALIKRLQAVMRQPIECEGKSIRCGLSIGVARVPADGQNPAAILKAADLALYKAKADGRNTFRFFEPQMLEALAKRRRVQEDVRQALVSGDLDVHFQPIIRTSDSQLSGFEALVRWNHPERGVITPTDFIAVAEETDLIDEIGALVLERACRAAASWPAHLQIAVNVSPMQVRRNTLMQAVVDALLSSGLEPNRLTLEITEAVLLDEELAYSTLTKIKELGIRLALDDFGTGYSSLGYLQRYPFDKIKIDRSFITKMGEDAVSRAIVQAVVGIASARETETVAEGVETVFQACFLRALRCTEMQGYFISKPLSLVGVDAYLKTMASAA